MIASLKSHSFGSVCRIVGLLLASLLMGTCIAVAQMTDHPSHDDHQESGLVVGGTFTYRNDTKGKTTTFDFCPEIGWRLDNTWAGGLLTGLSFESEGHEEEVTRAKAFSSATTIDRFSR